MLEQKPPIPKPPRNPQAPFYPPADTSTYRDLLLFEERLKMNAEMLRRRRRRYGMFLWTFVGTMFLITYRLVFQPPQTLLSIRALQASLAVIFITLVLFFASGMYDEKIRYAYSYLNHSNKALRPLNMHLNMRRPKWSPLDHLPFPLFNKPQPQRNSPTLRRTSNTVMGQIPPTTNPRGELIFSSKVDRNFREGYERYRAAFERRREERVREEAKTRGRWFWNRHNSEVRMGPTPPISRRGTPPLGTRSRGTSPGGSKLKDQGDTDGRM